MPRAFLVKPRPLEQVPVTSPDVTSSPWRRVGHDVNNNDVDGSSSSRRPSCIDLTTLRGLVDDDARPTPPPPSLFHWLWSSSPSAAPSSSVSWRGPALRRDVAPSTQLSSSPPPSAAAAAAAVESATSADHVAQHLWWSSSPHSDVSASGLKLSRILLGGPKVMGKMHIPAGPHFTICRVRKAYM